ncbi:uncharacterized protein KD926_006853 [Aspergillus affinis]|uniref:uncharacterized protein n=1 Tax=Aspergillus affinis TaxID=1070780 RepID=UPI0022FF18FA|nr:uncharacterized protein KD926_006853 [Aspergillus affinis]KAI9041457.1 hypothetical protein KD926_006853 [Aspergillus affinis]
MEPAPIPRTFQFPPLPASPAGDPPARLVAVALAPHPDRGLPARRQSHAAPLRLKDVGRRDALRVVRGGDPQANDHFYLAILQRMPRVRDLALTLADMLLDPRRENGQRYLDMRQADLQKMTESNPEWTRSYVKPGDKSNP